jgi:DNA-binding NarL/FixJ family response regulator
VTIRLAICEDHRMLADALAMVIADDEELELVAPPVDTAEDAVALCAEHRPDVILMDVQLRGAATGLDATRELKTVSPDTQVVIVSGMGQDRLLVEAVEAGASGFLDKTEAVEEAIKAIKAAAAGEPLIDPIVLARLIRQAAEERAQGMRNDDIARSLHLSIRTVQTHVQNILTKLGVHSRLEAVAFAARAGIVSVGGQVAEA